MTKRMGALALVVALCATSTSAQEAFSIYRKYKNSFPGGLSPESGIVVQVR